MSGIGQGLADGNAFQPGQGHDLARLGGFDFHALQPLVDIQVAGTLGQHSPIDGHARQGLPGDDLTGKDAPHGGHAAVFVIAQGGDQHLQRRIQINLRPGDVAQNGLEERLQVRAKLVGQCRPGRSRRWRKPPENRPARRWRPAR